MYMEKVAKTAFIQNTREYKFDEIDGSCKAYEDGHLNKHQIKCLNND